MTSRAATDKIQCDACPIRCYIKPGRTGACDRYGNEEGILVRVDPLVLLQQAGEHDTALVPFAVAEREWSGDLLSTGDLFVTGSGAGTTYPDYKPAPFIVSAEIQGVDMVTVVTEAIFSYCGVKVKIDTDRHIGPERSEVRADGEAVGHVTTGEYGSQMLSLGGVNHLTGGSKREGLATMRAMLALCSGESAELTVDGGSELTIQAGMPPTIDGIVEERMRVGCGSATIGMFGRQWFEHVDDVVVVDDHITGVLSEHQAGKYLGIQPTGIKVVGRKSTPGRYFNVADPGTGWGGTNITNPLDILSDFNPRFARAGMTLMMVSTTGEQYAFFVLNEDLVPMAAPLPDPLQASVARIRENCEPAMTSVLFMAGAGGSLRAGATENPVALTRAIKNAITRVTCGGAPVAVWPGGGITFMVDVTRVPKGSFGYVPTPALVAPLEFTMRLGDYSALGGHMASVLSIDDVTAREGIEIRQGLADNPWPRDIDLFPWNL
ncbi:MAG: 6-hydroxynicotinate reductase [Actinomycetota bacterium]|nr:6-hydroxynicotinate reductase [Actinomycetota bacterium]